jgi:hypothetical protein
MNSGFVGPILPTVQDVSVNVPKNTSSNVVGDILNNLPNILGALSGFFGKQTTQQQQQAPPAPDMTPVYLLGGLALIILLIKK